MTWEALRLFYFNPKAVSFSFSQLAESVKVNARQICIFATDVQVVRLVWAAVFSLPFVCWCVKSALGPFLSHLHNGESQHDVPWWKNVTAARRTHSAGTVTPQNLQQLTETCYFPTHSWADLEQAKWGFHTMKDRLVLAQNTAVCACGVVGSARWVLCVGCHVLLRNVVLKLPNERSWEPAMPAANPNAAHFCFTNSESSSHWMSAKSSWDHSRVAISWGMWVPCVQVCFCSHVKPTQTLRSQPSQILRFR